MKMKKKKRRGMMNYVLPENSKLHFEYPLTTKWIFHKPMVPVSNQKVYSTLPVQKAYSVQEKKILMGILEEILEALTMLAWKLARPSKEEESMTVPDKPISKPVNTPMLFNLFKF